MSMIGRSLFSTELLNSENTNFLFHRAQLFKNQFAKKNRIDHLVSGEGLSQKCLSLVFFEPSTRTRMSFQMAAFRLGIRVTNFENLYVSSVSKGESLTDTVRNLAALQPDVMAVRYGENSELDECLAELPVPVINCGRGITEHPTQALVDAFTIQEFRGQIRGERVLIVGDVLHSRVANSNLNLLTSLGADVAYCAPEEYVPHDEQWRSVKTFSDLKQAMEWATVCMCLRIQKERHALHAGIGLSRAEYRERFRVGTSQMKRLIKDGILMHPGPVVRGVEVSSKALADPRCKVLDQVHNSVFVRAALLSAILGLEVSSS